jgi:hypothetical protein
MNRLFEIVLKELCERSLRPRIIWLRLLMQWHEFDSLDAIIIDLCS